MTERCTSTCAHKAASLPGQAAFTRMCFAFVLALLLGLVPAKADEQESEYLRIYQDIQQADALDAGGKTAEAFNKYQRAYSDLVKFRKAYPSWSRDMVTFRLNYVAKKAAACNEKLNAAAPEPSTGASTNAGAQSGSQTAAPTADQPLVTLLEPGAEPRKVLRLQPKAGEKQTVALTVKTRIERTVEGKPQPEVMQMPALSITLETTVKDVSAEGDIIYENVIAEAAAGEEPPGSPPGSGAAMSAAFAGLKGLTTSGVLSDRGFSKRRDASKPGERPPQQTPPAARMLQAQMEQSLTRLTAPLPEEPVGTGAKWEVKMTDKAVGIVKAIYEVVSVEEQRVRAKTTVTVAQLSAETAKNPQFSKMKIDSSGDVTIDLNRIMPAEGHLVQTMDVGSMGSGQGQNMAGKTVTEFLIQTK